MRASALDAATEKVLAGIADPAVADRYPDRAHLVPADHPRHGDMATRALFEGDPVVLVFPDGRELLLTPGRPPGRAGRPLARVLTWLHTRRHGPDGDVLGLPPRTRIQARDSSGLPTAA